MSHLILIFTLFCRLLVADLELFASGKTQTLQWDAAGRLVGLVQRDNPTNGFFWTAIYDATGRRLRTIQVPVVNGYTNYVGTLTLDSYFDPQVEFEEVGVAVNGQRTWKVLGPDLDGHYGSLHGVGGLEATVRESDGLTTPVINDYFGNVLATIAGTTTSWNPVRVGSYGPVLGYQSPTLTVNTPLADTLTWRSRGIDPSGFYCLGARYYDPVAGHFLSADPLGHAASMDLHSFCGGDPINRFDPTGRFGKSHSDLQGFAAGLADAGASGPSSYGALANPSSGAQNAYGIGSGIGQVLKVVGLVGGLFIAPEAEGGVLAEGELAEGGLLAEEGFDLGAEANLARETEAVLPETEATLSSETEIALPAEAEAAREPAIANTFAESGQGEFGFAGELEASSAQPAVQPAASQISESASGSSHFTQAATAESNIGASQPEQLELNFKGSAGDFKPLNNNNYRFNLQQLTGLQGNGMDAHHIFPQAARFQAQWDRAGININDPNNMAWWNISPHRSAAGAYNKAWTEFFRNNANASAEQMQNFGRSLMSDYGF